MITVRLYTGQVLTFPDHTSEEAIRRASQEVLSGEADRKRGSAAGSAGKGASFDLSGLRGPQPEPQQEPVIDDPRARTEARLRAALPVATTADAAVDPRPSEERVDRPPEWWRSVTGDPSGRDQSVEIARDRQLRAAEELGTRGMQDLGFEDRGTYYFNPTTEERVLKRRRTDAKPESLDPNYRPLTPDQQRLKDVGAPYRQPDSPESLELARAIVGGIPGRVAASEAGLLLPHQAAEAVGVGIKREVSDLASGRLPQNTGESFAAGARRGWAESPITQGAETINREVVEPDREWLARAATAAGVSPRASAALDTAQMVAGEALNPGNYIVLDMLRGVSAAERAGTAAARTASLEARGGARTISTGEGLVAHEYGRGTAPSELAQLRTARSGKYGPSEPLMYHDPHPTVGGWKGVIPDSLRRIAGKPWRTHRGYDPDRPLEIAEPTGPAPRPRDVRTREAIPVPIVGGSPEARDHVASLWDYASRRHPRIAKTVRGIKVADNPGDASVLTDDGILIIGEGAGIDTIMHEFTHLGQYARPRYRRTADGQIVSRPRNNPRSVDEATAIRRGEVYSRAGRIGEPTIDAFDMPRPWPPSAIDDAVNRANALTPQEQKWADWTASYDRGEWGPRDGPIDPDPEVPPSPPRPPFRVIRGDNVRDAPLTPVDDIGADISERFSSYLRSAGIDDPDSYYELPRLKRVELDRGFASADEGPATAAWGDFLSSENLEPRDYFELPLLERAKLEDQYRIWVAGQSETPEVPERIGLTDVERVDLARRGHPEFTDPPSGPGLGPGARLMSSSAPPIRLPEEIAAERMGWKLPDGDPRTTRHASLESGNPPGSIDPITTPEGQTNIAAQVDPVHGYFGDPEVAGYVIEESDRVFRSQGPPQTWSTLEEMAVRRGLSTDQLLADRTHWNVMPPEVRLRTLYVIKGKEQTRNELQAKLAAGTATDADKAELLHTVEVIGDLTRLGAKTGSAYGRALNSLKMEARNSLLEPQMMRQRIYKQYEKEIDANRDILDALARLDPNNPEELAAFQRMVDRPTFREYMHEYWMASILSSPASHERNILGNAIYAISENAVVRPLSAGFDFARVAGTDAAREVFLRETPEAVIGLTRGIQQGLRRGLEVLKRGYPEGGHGKLLPMRSAFGRSQNKIVREVVGPVVTMPLRMLSAADELFKAMNFTAELYAQAARSAAKSGLSGKDFTAEVARLVATPPEEITEAARSFALRATFNDDASAVGKAVMNLRDLPKVHPETAIGRAGAETYRSVFNFVIPFVKIADRLMVRGFEYTPVGAIRAVGARQSGNMAEAAGLAARSAIGSAVMAYAATLAAEGRLTAGAPTDKRERDAFHAAGKQAWSVRTEDGTWIPYGQIQPLNVPLAIVASAWKGWRESGEDPDAEKLGHAAAKVGQFVTDQSYMEGLSKAMEALGGGDGAGRAFSELAAGTIGGFAPYSGLQRSVAQAIDPRVIDAKTIGDRIKRNIPGMSLDMRAKLTPWGEEVVPVGGRLRSVLAPGSILLPSQEQEDPLDAELARLDMPLGTVGKSMADKLKKRPAPGSGKAATDWLDRELGRLGMPLSYVDQKVSGMYGNGKSRGTWKLDDDEWHMYQQTAGRATRKVLERLFSRADYQGWDSDRQRDEVERAIGAAREYAKMWAVRYHRANRPRTMTEVD